MKVVIARDASQKTKKLMKTDAFFINTSRGAVVDEAVMIEALQ